MFAKEFLKMIKQLNSLIWVLNHPENKHNKIKVLAKILWWKINKIFFNLPTIVEITKGIKYIAYPNSSFGSLIVYTKLPEYYEMKYFLKMIESSDVVIDVGAHMGDYSLLASSKITNGKVICLEPSKEALKVLRENVTINNIENKVLIFPNIASDKNGYVNFVEDDVSEISHIDFLEAKKQNIKVKSLTLDSIILSMKIKKIKFIKIDVEGAELKVLKGLEKSLSAGIIDYLLIEVNAFSHNYGVSPTKTINFVKSFGYKVFCFNKFGKLVRLDDFPEDKGYVNMLAVCQ